MCFRVELSRNVFHIGMEFLFCFQQVCPVILTSGAVEAREPRLCAEAGLEQDGLDQSTTQYGCCSPNLRIPVLNVLQDVTDVLLLC